MIKVYTGDIGTIDEKTADRLLACLSAERKERVHRYRREKDRLLGIGAGVLLSLALSERQWRNGTAMASGDGVIRGSDAKENISGVTYTRRESGSGMFLAEVDFSALDTDGFPSAEQLETGKGAHGKPYLKRYPDIHYNLSHSGTKVMLVTFNSEVGCDIQKLGPVRERVVRKAFAPAEQAYVSAAEGTERDVRFTEVWARKESFLKAAGTGIERELGTFSVIGKNGKPVKTVTAEEGTFEILCPAEVEGYACFICVKRG
ncbi:MAG: 4'-phosphopantetheinyl transferase superfamily protein [Lachnospiraceae bacterium]|nr:4'-phosphopantetheinyl transferase superfamily protein [Lachnospiraceae bacterium]